eukprot:CAMPEP_0179106154 /NCGR_PEP_ID=MMETSP0796-20121207/49337_1 /TAXON_ID=73915 /ORGANISM="Pyrodinium bahamense, Strain pbaha01" /LENGTH=229 /DNA_ID=CAMNT_0020804163 /DNA_START=54 /DNA_END=743 /DNA_ORIENTATION=-
MAPAMVALAPSVSGLRGEQRHRRRCVAVVGACLCLGAAILARPRIAWVSAAPTPAAVASRRAAVAGLATAVLGAAAGTPQQAYAEEVPGTVSAPGETPQYQFGTTMNKYKDPPEVIAKRMEARQKGKEREAALKNEFRGYFSAFAADDASIDSRIENLKSMQNMIQQERMLPIGITRDDLFKGTRAVKFNIGCVRTKVKEGDCKKLEKAIDRLFAALDKTQDLTVLMPR